nr:unnamed protein product [Haemonchus contortus]
MTTFRSHSVEASLHCSSDSIMSFMSRGVGELRDGIRVLRQRARSLRPARRPPSLTAPVRPCPYIICSHCENRDTALFANTQVMQRSDLSSVASHISDDQSSAHRIFLSPQTKRWEITTSVIGSSSHPNAPKIHEKRADYSQTKPEIKDTVNERMDEGSFERLSPVEEWSSGSRDSPLLEMSRYDNVPCAGYECTKIESATKRYPVHSHYTMKTNGVYPS